MMHSKLLILHNPYSKHHKLCSTMKKKLIDSLLQVFILNSILDFCKNLSIQRQEVVTKTQFKNWVSWNRVSQNRKQ